MRNKKLKLTFWIIVGLFAGYGLCKGLIMPLYQFATFNSISEEDKNIKRKSDKADYEQLFKTNVANEMHLGYSLMNKRNSSILCYTYKQNYSFAIHRLIVKRNVKFKDILVVNKGSSKISGASQGLDGGTYTFLFASEYDPQINKLIIDYNGRKPVITSGPSFVSTQVWGSEIGIRYNQNNSPAIKLTSTDSGKTDNLVNITLLQQKGNLYLILVFANRGRLPINFVKQLLN